MRTCLSALEIVEGEGKERKREGRKKRKLVKEEEEIIKQFKQNI